MSSAASTSRRGGSSNEKNEKILIHAKLTRMDGENERKESFTLIQQRDVRVIAFDLCPSMDLCAILSSDSSVMLYRTQTWSVPI